MAYRRLPLNEGFVEYVVDGPDDADDLLIFHVGTPSLRDAYEDTFFPRVARDIARMRSTGRAGGK